MASACSAGSALIVVSCFRAFVAMSIYSDLNGFVAGLERHTLLTRVAEPVSPRLEMAAVIDRACRSPGGGPALLFDKPTGFDIPVAANLYGSMERMCLALGVNALDDLAREIDEL